MRANLPVGDRRDESPFDSTDAGYRRSDRPRDRALRAAARQSRDTELSAEVGELPPGEAIGLVDGIRSVCHGAMMQASHYRRVIGRLPAATTIGQPRAWIGSIPS